MEVFKENEKLISHNQADSRVEKVLRETPTCFLEKCRERKIQKINANLGEADYPVFLDHSLADEIGQFLLSQTKDRKVLMVSDANLSRIYVEPLARDLTSLGFELHQFVMIAGKANKTMSEVMKLIEMLHAGKFSRDSTIIALGGGVIGDLAGFVASCWYRGTSLIHIPTTLVAMIDSSIGGKCAVNFKDTVNAIGSYHHPAANFVDLDLLEHLPDREFKAGMSEVIKCALIADGDFFRFLAKNHKLILRREKNVIRQTLRRTIELKVSHVNGDVRESGKRLLLNFGHTLGHALEMATQKSTESLRHGEAVAIGTAAIIAINQKHFGLSQDVVRQTLDLLLKFELPTKFVARDFGFKRKPLIEKCMNLVVRDKKKKDGALRLILLDQIGSAFVQSCHEADVIRFGFEAVIE